MDVPLKLYRRHRKECEGGHPEDTRICEFEKGRRGWKKCRCLVHVSGTLAGKFSRKQSGKTDWDEAKALAAQWEKAGSWDGGGRADEPVSLPIAPASPDPKRVTVAHAMAAFTVAWPSDWRAPFLPGSQRAWATYLKLEDLFIYASSGESVG